MNLTSAAANGPPSNPTADNASNRCEATQRTGEPATRDAFERALLAKRPLLTFTDDAATAAPEVAAPMLLAGPPVPLAACPSAAPPAAAGAVEVTTGTRAAIEAALHNALPQGLCPAGAADRPAVWEASIAGPQGAIEVRAERIGAQGAPPVWGLTIGAAPFGADVATRHAPRLHDRLRRHGIDVDHVRIERDKDDVPR